MSSRNFRHSRTKAKLARPSVAGALIVIDEAPLRTSIAEEFRKIYAAYSRHLGDLKTHEETTRPSYYRWFQGLFADRLRELERLQNDLFRKVEMLDRMRELCIFEGYSRDGAFKQAIAEFADGAPGGREDAGDDARDNTRDDTGDEGGHDGDADKDSFGRREHEHAWSQDAAQDRHPPATEAAIETRVKSLYRKLAQALHPDVAGELTNESSEYWQETQDAYQSRDLGRLELIWAVIRLQKDALARELRIFDLRSALIHVQDKLRTIKKEKRRLSRADPSWGFKNKNRTVLESEITRDLAEDERSLRQALADIEVDLKLFQPSRKRQLSFDL